MLISCWHVATHRHLCTKKKKINKRRKIPSNVNFKKRRNSPLWIWPLLHCNQGEFVHSWSFQVSKGCWASILNLPESPPNAVRYCYTGVQIMNFYFLELSSKVHSCLGLPIPLSFSDVHFLKKKIKCEWTKDFYHEYWSRAQNRCPQTF